MRIQAILILLLVGMFSKSSTSQIDFVWEPFLHDWGPDDDPSLQALNGFITWRLFVEVDFGDPATPDYVTAIVGDITDPDFLPLQLTFSCCPWQHPTLSQSIGQDINCNLFPPFPDLQYDSWVTLGDECATNNPDNPVGTQDGDILSVGNDWQQSFEQCDTTGILIDDFAGGGWFMLPDVVNAVNGFVDENNLLLIGQFTLPVGCELLVPATLCIQYFPDGDIDEDNSQVACVEINEVDQCFNNPIFVNNDSLADVLCFGGSEGYLEFSFSGGSGNLDFSLLNQDMVSFDPTSSDTPIYETLPGGTYTFTVTDLDIEDQDGVSCQSSMEVVIVEPTESLDAAVNTITDVACQGDSTGVIHIIPTGGTGPFTITTDDFDVFVEDIGGGVYEFDSLDITSVPIVFDIIDINGCEASVQGAAPLGPDSPLVVELDSLDHVSCFGLDNGAIFLNITSPNPDPSIIWTSDNGFIIPANTEDPSNLPSGTYTVDVDDTFNCPYSTSFTIEEPVELEIDNAISTMIDCFGDCNSSISYDILGGVEPYTEILNQNALPATSGSLCAGSAQLTIQDANLCVASVDIPVNENFPIVINSLASDVNCPNGSDGSITIDPTGGDGPITSTINPAGTFMDNTFSDLTASTYTITSTDSLNCSVSETVVVTQPNDFIVNPSSDNVTCNGFCDGVITVGNIIGGTEPYNICINDGVNSICNETGIFEDLCPGSYDLSFTDGSNCEYVHAETFIITEPDALGIESLTISPPGCGGECTAEAVVVATGGTPNYIYIWNGGSPGPSAIVGLCAGTDSLTIIDANGCEFDEEFEIDEPQEIEIVINSTNVTCTGMCDGSFQFTATGIEPLDIQFGNIPNTDVCEGDYPIFVTDSLGCTATDTIHIEPNLISDMEFVVFTTPVSCWNEGDGTATMAVTGGNGEISYLWSDPSQQTTATAIGLVEDFYTITIVDEVGCTFTENVVIEPTVGCFFISNALTPNGDGFNDEWILGGLEYYPEAKVEVFNRWGQQVFESIGTYTAWNGLYNSRRLPIADYYYVITYDPDSAPLTGTVTIKY